MKQFLIFQAKYWCAVAAAIYVFAAAEELAMRWQ